MLSTLIKSLKLCPFIENITSCAMPVATGTFSLMPGSGSSYARTYTDGQKVYKRDFALLYKADFSPLGDRDDKTDVLLNKITDFINENEFDNFISVNANPYIVLSSLPSECVYSIKLTVTYTK